jgi:uncharacterized protein with GYD domain
MAYYLVQVAYSAEAWAAMVQSPHVHLEGLRPLVERLGGTLEGAWLAFGEYDAVLICQMPDHTSAAALAMGAATEAAVKTIKTTPLMTLEEGLNALRQATGADQHASDRSAPASGLPVPRARPGAYKDMFSSGLQRFKQRLGKMVTGH